MFYIYIYFVIYILFHTGSGYSRRGCQSSDLRQQKKITTDHRTERHCYRGYINDQGFFSNSVTSLFTSCTCSPGDIYRIVLGKHDLSVQEDTEQIRDVLRIVVHPGWNIECVACGWDGDLLLLLSIWWGVCWKTSSLKTRCSLFFAQDIIYY